MSDTGSCLVDCVAYHKPSGCFAEQSCPFLHRQLPEDVCRANLGGRRCRNYNCSLNHPTPEALLPAPRSEVERLSALSTEVVQVWAGRSNCKYEVRKKMGQQAKDKSIECWDDWARERKWSWGRRRDEEERWSQKGRGEVNKQSMPKQEMSKQGIFMGQINNKRECGYTRGARRREPASVQLESWDQWARERKLSWGNKKKEELVENKLGCSSSIMVSNSKGDSSSDFSLPDIQVLNIPGSVPALEVKRVCQNVGQLSKFRYYSMLGEPGVKGLKQVIVNYVAAEHYKWAKEKLGKEVRKLVVGETWAATASPFTIRAVVMGAKSSVVMGMESSADTGSSNGKGRVVDLTQRQEVRCPRPQAHGQQAPRQSSGTSLLAKALARSNGETMPKNPTPVQEKVGSAFMKEVVTKAIHGNLVSNMMENEL